MKINSKIFKEYDIRGEYNKEINERTAYALGLAFAKLLKAKKIVIGRDARWESEQIFWPFIAGLSKANVKVYSLGICSTSELFFAVGINNFSGGCMVTASHSPLGQTGFKLCDSRGLSLGLYSGLDKLAKIATKIKLDKLNKLKGEVEFINVSAQYKKFIKTIINVKKLTGLKVVLDASNGSGARLIEEIFADLPLYSWRMNFNAHDKYPDHGPNPLLKENQILAMKEVKKFKADAGIIFDGDADRIIFIDETGKLVEPYHLNCLLAEIILSKKKKQKIIIDARLGLGIKEVIKLAGGEAITHRSGYANIIRTMRNKKILFACENSGHFMFNFRWLKNQKNYAYGEAILPALLVLEYLQDKKISLSSAVAKFRNNYLISGEINFRIKSFEKLKNKIKEKFKNEKLTEIDGLSVTSQFADWFFNIRPSHTEPLVRLNIEAKNYQVLQKLKINLLKMIK